MFYATYLLSELRRRRGRTLLTALGLGVGGPPGAGGPRSINVAPLAVAGVDADTPTLAAISPPQIVSGRYVATGRAREAVLNVAYARRHGLSVGDTITLKGTTLKVVGL